MHLLKFKGTHEGLILVASANSEGSCEAAQAVPEDSLLVHTNYRYL